MSVLAGVGTPPHVERSPVSPSRNRRWIASLSAAWMALLLSSKPVTAATGAVRSWLVLQASGVVCTCCCSATMRPHGTRWLVLAGVVPTPHDGVDVLCVTHRTWASGVIRVVAKHQRQAAGRVSHGRHFISEQDFKDQVYPVLLTVTRYLQQRTDAAGSVARAPAVPARSRSPTAHARAHKRRRRNSVDGVSTTRSPGATGSPHSRHEPRTVWTWKHAAAQLTMNQRRQQQQGPPVSVTKPSLHAFWCGLRMIVQTAESPACAALLQSPTVGDRIVSAMLAGMRYCAAPVRAHSAPLGSHDGAQSMSSAASRPRTARPGMGRLRSFSVGGVAELSGVRKRSQLLLGSDGGNGSGGDSGGDSGGSAAATTQRGRRNRLHSVDVTHGDRHTVHRDVRAQLRETLSLAPVRAKLVP